MTLAPRGFDVGRPRGYCLGVDLGTTFVAAAICDGAKPEMLTLGGRSVVIPSAAYLDEDGTLLCGEAAVHRSVTDPDRVARGFKRRLGDPTPVRMGVGSRLAAELLAAQLGEVLRVAAETEGAAPDRVMLTHPANWGPFRRDVFAEVAKLAGLEGAPTVTEPEAAAIHYARSRELADGRLVAVYDLGGGTFDATVLRADPAHVELLGVPEGIERLGGLDFDEALFAHLDHACDGVLSALDSHDPQAAVTLARLEQDLVLAKEHLSVDAHATVPVFLPDRNFEVRITRGVFEDLIRAHIESTVGALERTLRSAHLTASDLDAILLVGGSSRIPLVAEMITEALGRPVVVDTHPKYVVALGAAALAAQLDAAQIDAAQIDTAHSNTAQIDTAPVETAPQAVATHAEVASWPAGATKSRRRAWMASAGHDRMFAGARHLSHADDRRGAKLPAGPPAALLVGGSRDDAGAADPTLWDSPSDADWYGGQSSPGSTGTGHAPAEGADGADDPRPASRAGTRVVVAALALVGISTAGFLSRGSVSPVAEGLTAATPPATCQPGCALDPLRDTPAKASAPSSRCPGVSDTPSGCESGLPRVPPPSGTTNRVPVKALPSRPRPALPIPPANLAPQNVSPAAVGEKNDEYKETSEKTSAEKTSAEKTSEKKRKQKAKDSSGKSSDLDLF